jgi:hypothetical protein
MTTLYRSLLVVGMSMVIVGCANRGPATQKAEVDPRHVLTAEEKQEVRRIGLLTVPQPVEQSGKVDAARTVASVVSAELKARGYTVFTVSVPRDATASVDYAALGRKVDAYLDVRVLEAAYKAHGNKWGNAQDFRPSVSIPMTLVSAKDGTVLYSFTISTGDLDQRMDGAMKFAPEGKYSFRDQREMARFAGYADEGLKATVTLAAKHAAAELGDAPAAPAPAVAATMD